MYQQLSEAVTVTRSSPKTRLYLAEIRMKKHRHSKCMTATSAASVDDPVTRTLMYQLTRKCYLRE